MTSLLKAAFTNPPPPKFGSSSETFSGLSSGLSVPISAAALVLKKLTVSQGRQAGHQLAVASWNTYYDSSKNKKCQENPKEGRITSSWEGRESAKAARRR